VKVRRVHLGRWSTEGNAVDATLLASDEPVQHVELVWASLPLSIMDELYYYDRILPALTKRAAEFLGAPGRALVVRL
jgi:hypothetical protein